MSNAAKLKKISIKKSGKIIIKDVSFSIDRGQFAVLVGPNGAGKTSLIRAILGLDQITGGTISIDSDLEVGYMPQKLDFDNNIPMNCAALAGLLSNKQYHRASWQGADRIRKFAELEKIKKTSIQAISGGQMQKLLLSCILLAGAQFLVLDEPTKCLDIKSVQELYSILGFMRETHGTTILMTSHDMLAVFKKSDKIICINGHICCIGKPSEIESNAELKNSLSEIGLYKHFHDHKH